MTVVDLFCGLGNQMFQYAFARLLQELYAQEGKKEDIQIINHFIDNYIEDASEIRQLALNHLFLLWLSHGYALLMK